MNRSLVDNKYEKLEPLGTGGSGTVWKARNVSDDYYCAIKILSEPVKNENDVAYQALVREFQLIRRAGSFGHPGIPQLYGIGICNREAYIEMSYYKGDSIYEILKKETILPFGEIVSMFKDILGTMAYLHVDIYKDLMNAEEDHLQADLAHGGRYILKPEDVQRLISKYSICHNDLHSKQFIRNHYSGNYVLLDYGLALQGKEAVRKTLINAGTPGYSAPEKLRGKVPDTRTDVFALGALMYECLTGDVPFPDDNHEEKYAPIEEKRSAVFSAKFPGRAITPEYLCPRWLQEIVLKCLSFDPNKRYPHAKALLIDFEARLKEYTTKREDGRTGLEQDTIARQNQLLESKDRRIASQQELIADNEQQIAKLDEFIKKAKAELQASANKYEQLSGKQARTRRSRNVGWALAIIVACVLAFNLFSCSHDSPADPKDIGRLTSRITSLSDSLSFFREGYNSRERAMAEAKRLQATLEQNVRELQGRLATISSDHDVETRQLRDSLLKAERDLEKAQGRITELERKVAAPSGSRTAAASTSVVISRSNNGTVKINNGTINNENLALRRELESCRVTIDSLNAAVSRYKAELLNAARSL